MSTKVIDLAKWNEVSSYANVKKSGINYVILKAINCSNVADSKFESHYKGCIGAGIDVIGTYHYSYATTVAKATASAQAWIKIVNGRCKRYFLDWEDSSLPKNATAVTIILTYKKIIEAAGGEFYMYAGLSWYNSYLKPYATKLNCPFWIARYPSMAATSVTTEPNNKYMPAIANDLCGWQYSSACTVNGIAGRVDISNWYKELIVKNTVVNSKILPVESNPFPEPSTLIQLGSKGSGADWVLWYLWRFGLLLTNNITDTNKVDSEISAADVEIIKQSQRLLGTTADGKVGKITRTLYKKIC